MILVEPWGGIDGREAVLASSSSESLVPAHGSALGQRWSFGPIAVRLLSTAVSWVRANLKKPKLDGSYFGMRSLPSVSQSSEKRRKVALLQPSFSNRQQIVHSGSTAKQE